MCSKTSKMEGVPAWPPHPTRQQSSSIVDTPRSHKTRKSIGRGRRGRRIGVGGRRWRYFPPRVNSRSYYHEYSPLSSTDTEESSSDMPGGFENSAMKTSFSLSSLQPSSANLESPEHARLQDRPYSSLRKKPRKDPENESWRRSWGSREENKDEFWAALKNNYQYLMDSHLIESCKEARRDLQYGASPTHEWSFDQFTEQFTELDTWLNSIQEAVYSKEETVIDRNLRLSHMEEMQRKAYKRKLFNNQSGRLVVRMPELKEEVAWRVSYLNSKWERLEQTVTPRKRTHPDHLDVCTDVEHELRCLRKWIKETEQRLQPLNFRVTWTLQELEEKAKEHEVVQRDVWSHGKIVCSVVKLCEKLAWAEGNQESVRSWVRGRRYEPSQAVRFARGLERRWQLLYLASLEWQCHIERLTNDLKTQGPASQTNSILESDEEPVTKHPRLSDEVFDQLSPTAEVFENDILMETSEVCQLQQEMEVETQSPCSNERLYCAASMETEEVQEKIVIIQTLNTATARKLFLDETSKFDMTDHSLPNVGIFYFKHSDTDTEQDGSALANAEVKSVEVEESSEEEWTYTGAGNQSVSGCEDTPLVTNLQEVTQEDSSQPPEQNKMVEVEEKAEVAGEVGDESQQRPRQEVIEQLVKQAEEMVREEVASPARKAIRVFEPLSFTHPPSTVKYTRIEEWLQLHDPDSKQQAVGDSCDASGEYTTEDDDGDGRELSLGDSQQDLDTTLIPTIQTPTNTEPKVIMRVKKREGMNAPRPWSVSDTLPNRAIDHSHLPHSISESAIHQLAHQPTTPHCGGKVDSSVNTVSTLSSSTVEDTAQTQEGSGGGCSSNSLRRRKVKLRKRNVARKSESGSEGMLSPMVHSDSSHPALVGSPAKLLPPVKPSSRRSSADKTFIDSPHRRYPTTVLSPSSSETDSEDESEDSVKLRRKFVSAPVFRIGPAHTLTAYANEGKDKLVSADSSYSEQAWDNYQEKYMSEPYSEEPADSEAARRLLEFGDDYRNFLDSQSDCASSQGRPLLHKRRRVPPPGNESDSDHDLEDLWHLVRQSNDQLAFSEHVFNSQLLKASPHLALASDFAELVATCKENVRCLNIFLDSIEQYTALLSEQGRKDIRALIERWESLEKGAEDLQRVRSLQREMACLKAEFYETATKVGAVEPELEDRDHLERRIQQVKSELSRLRDLKTQLLQVNVAVHRFLTDSGHPTPAPLKDEVAELYRLWDETYNRVWSEQKSLQKVGAAWQQFESHLQGLQVALRTDQETLRLLDKALQRGGAVSPDLASSVRDLAKVLSEKQDTPTILTQDDVSEGGVCGGTEGSLSDSGISDSGSEQELSERERRLSALRRLVRDLEAVLAPGSTAIANMSKRIEATENELRGLQQTCRDLIVRTAVCAETKRQTGDVANGKPVAQQQTTILRSCRRSVEKKEEGEEDKPNWLWRVMRAALPIQLAILALFCVACLLEPHCCDSINNLNLSISPQLRYVRGPPPV